MIEVGDKVVSVTDDSKNPVVWTVEGAAEGMVVAAVRKDGHPPILAYYAESQWEKIDGTD